MPRYGSKYKYKRKYPSKKGGKRRRFNMSRKQQQGGYLRVMRWSSRDATNSCHILLQGSDAAPDQTGTTTFQLADTAASAELTALFDNYKITKVLYRWVVTRNPDWNSTTANRGWSIRVAWAHDFNDQIVISQAQLFQRAGLKEVYLNSDRLQSKWFSIRPAVLVQQYESAVATSYGPKWSQWIDTAETATPHYGIKYAYQNLYAGTNLRLEAKVYMECKGIS